MSSPTLNQLSTVTSLVFNTLLELDLASLASDKLSFLRMSTDVDSDCSSLLLEGRWTLRFLFREDLFFKWLLLAKEWCGKHIDDSAAAASVNVRALLYNRMAFIARNRLIIE